MAWVTQVGGVCGGAEDAHTPAGMVDGGENVLPLAGERDRVDEAHRQDRLRLRTHEVSPGNGCPAPSWKSAQRRAGQGHEQGCEQRPVLRPQSRALTAWLSFQDSELMA
jgi:hypothetical protein